MLSRVRRIVKTKHTTSKKRRIKRRRVLTGMEHLEDRRLLAANLWVDANGAANGTGTQSDPYNTIQKAAEVAVAGDTVNIRAGTYREEVHPLNSGTASNPITFRAYQGEQVTISGAESINGFTLHTGDIYQVSMPDSIGHGKDQIFVDGQMMLWARWPNTVSLDVSRPTWDTSSTVTPNTILDANGNPRYQVSLTDAGLPGDASDYVDAYVHTANGRGWIHHTGKIKPASSGDTLQFDLPESSVGYAYEPVDDDHYYVTGSFKTLDSAGEWFRAENTGTLSLWQPGGGDPDGSNVEYKARDYAFNLAGSDHITIDGIDLFAATIFMDANSDHNTIENINAKYLSHYDLIDSSGWSHGTLDTGIILDGSNHTLRNSTLAYSAGSGVSLSGTGHQILNNTIHDIDYMGTDAGGIYTKNSSSDPVTNVEIAYNTIYDGGRSLIVHRYLQSSNIHHNELYNALLQTSDGGGTYSYGITGSDFNDGKGTVIAYNRVHNVYAFGDPEDTLTAAGIYLDNGSNGYVVHHNAVWDSSMAMLLNTYTNDQNHGIYSNTLVGKREALHLANENSTGTEFWNNLLMGTPKFPDASWNANGSNFQTFDVQDAGLVDPDNGDLRLRSTSLAIDSGLNRYSYTNEATGSDPDPGATAYQSPAFLSGVGADRSLDRNAIAIGLGMTTIKAGHFDTLGEGISYHDSDNSNVLASYQYRQSEGVDVNSSTNIGYINDGEWLEYTIDAQSEGSYDLTFRLISFAASDSLTLTIQDASGQQTLGTVTPADLVSGTGDKYRLENVALTAGTQVVRVTFGGGGFNFKDFELLNSQQPSTGAFLIDATGSTTINAGDYDLGGEGIAYHDSDNINSAAASPWGVYRPGDSVDATSGTTVGWTNDGEWLEYTVDVQASGHYEWTFRVSSLGAGDSLTLKVFDDTGERTLGSLTQADLVPGTSDRYRISGVRLDSGLQVARVEMGGGGFNFKHFELLNSQQPHSGAFLIAAAGSTTINAGDYDLGGEGIAYHDSDNVNSAAASPWGVYRPGDSVDATSSTTVGWVNDSEWLEYAVEVETSGNYDWTFQISSLGAGDSVTLSALNDAGSTTLGTLTMANLVAGTTDRYRLANLSLAEGLQVARVHFSGGGFNFKQVQVAATPNPQQPHTTAPVISQGATTTINAGDYDLGGEGYAYHEVSDANHAAASQWGSIRPSDSVDVVTATNIGWIADGEWLEYTIDVQSQGSYDWTFRLSSFSANDSVTLIIQDASGKQVRGTVTSADLVPGTTDRYRLENVALISGTQIARIQFGGGGFNFKHFELL